jgi:predicted Zn-dependent peptidase
MSARGCEGPALKYAYEMQTSARADYLNDLLEGLRAGSWADVQAVAGKYLAPEELTIVLVGPAAVIEGQLREAKLEHLRRPLPKSIALP